VQAMKAFEKRGDDYEKGSIGTAFEKRDRAFQDPKSKL
jgi:hypothetical protein